MAMGNLAIHELMELHEILNFKTVCMTKSKMMQGLVFDHELKAMLAKDVQQSINVINTLQNLLTQGPLQ